MNIKVFNSTALGADHVVKNKPCQDYSLSWKSEAGDVQIAIVCDGHGSPTYVRSDVGSRLAAEITLRQLRRFVEETPPRLFVGKKAAVTAREGDLNTRYDTTLYKPKSQMSDDERMNYEQKCQFVAQVMGNEAQDEKMQELFTAIYNEWIDAIKADNETTLFKEEEKAALGNNRLAMAYGTTLMAFARTPYYWLAFHIGDGRLVVADRRLQWSQPVPWDCNCFLNYTTSLCNSNPVPLFRYAFDGTGDFPPVVICCSDGVEDSYGDYDAAPQNLHKLYSSIVARMLKVGYDDTIRQIDDLLPRLSAKGSKDDMSMAGIVDLDAIAEGVECSALRSRREELLSQRDERKRAEAELEAVVNDTETAKATLQNERQQKRSSFQQLLDSFLKKKAEFENEELRLNGEISAKENLATEKRRELEQMKNQHDQTDNEALREMSELKQHYANVGATIDAASEAEHKKWEEIVAALAPVPELEDEPKQSGVDALGEYLGIGLVNGEVVMSSNYYSQVSVDSSQNPEVAAPMPEAIDQSQEAK